MRPPRLQVRPRHAGETATPGSRHRSPSQPVSGPGASLPGPGFPFRGPGPGRPRDRAHPGPPAVSAHDHTSRPPPNDCGRERPLHREQGRGQGRNTIPVPRVARRPLPVWPPVRIPAFLDGSACIPDPHDTVPAAVCTRRGNTLASSPAAGAGTARAGRRQDGQSSTTGAGSRSGRREPHSPSPLIPRTPASCGRPTLRNAPSA